MREIIGDAIYDDEFHPVEMMISPGFHNGVPSIFYQITVEIEFDEDIDEILSDLDLENSGYTLESIFIKFLEIEKPELLESISGFDSESQTFVAYTSSENNQIKIAKEIQDLCIDLNKFKDIVEENLEFIKERYSE